jgi:hypothetical protein
MDAAGCGRGNALLPSMPEQTGENKNNVAHAARSARAYLDSPSLVA